MRRLALGLLVVAACSEDLSLPPVPGPSGGGCNVDSDCAKGICDVNHVCNASGCRTDAQCQPGICDLAALVCNPNACHFDSNCQAGYHCYNAYCIKDACAVDADCPGTEICQNLGGLYACSVGCRMDTQCQGCATCTGITASKDGRCQPAGKPLLSGTPTALKMTDNLNAAVTYVRTKHPTAMLIQVVGLGLTDAGTVDITANYTSRWTYGFQTGDGSMAPPVFSSVIYLLQGGTQCGYYIDNDGSLSQQTFIPDAVWPTYKDATTLIPLFEAHPRCALLAGTAQDAIVYSQQSSGPQFVIGDWKSQDWIANPVNPDGGLLNCP